MKLALETGEHDFSNFVYFPDRLEPPTTHRQRKAKLDFSRRSKEDQPYIVEDQMKTTILHHFDSFCFPLH